uniref:CPBP family glutamic-type intramembrane protease n=1 Tax=Agathobacter sp. TaxID=2021311 RepID=UPI0040572983
MNLVGFYKFSVTEVYFRGIIPRYLKEEFSTSGLVIVSTFIFGIGHIATAFIGSNLFEIVLTVLNAFIIMKVLKINTRL